MKIAIDCRELIDHPTGISRLLSEFISFASASREIELKLLGNRDTRFPDLESPNIEKIVINQGITLFWDQVKLLKALNRLKPDIFFSPYYKTPLLLSIPAVISIFDITYLLVEPYKSSPVNFIYYRNFIKLAARSAKTVLTCSFSTKTDLMRHLGIPEKKIEVVHFFVGRMFKKEAVDKIDKLKTTFGIKGKYILYVGNSNPHKNLERLIAAYRALPENTRGEYKLVLAGLRPDFIEKAGNRGADVIVLSYISDDDLPALYSGAGLFVFPSLYEGFGMPPLEAMACGCPVVSSNTSSMPEILGDACLYFDPSDTENITRSILKALNDDGIRKGMAEKGTARAALYTPGKTIEKLLFVFNKICEAY